MNLLNTTELYTLKQLILCIVDFISGRKKKKSNSPDNSVQIQKHRQAQRNYLTKFTEGVLDRTAEILSQIFALFFLMLIASRTFIALLPNN